MNFIKYSFLITIISLLIGGAYTALLPSQDRIYVITIQCQSKTQCLKFGKLAESKQLIYEIREVAYE